VVKWVADEFRISNGQLECLIHDALKKAGRLPDKKNSSPSESSGDRRYLYFEDQSIPRLGRFFIPVMGTFAA